MMKRVKLDNGFVLNFEENVIYIPLRNIWNETVAWALADLEQLNILKDYKFFQTRHPENSKVYASSWKGTMHQLIFGPISNKGYVIDHINSNGLDNRIQNLRLATHSQNAHNKIKKENTSSKYKGVKWNKAANKWEAGIIYKGEKFYLGVYIKEKDAAYIRDIWDIHLYKNFCCCNVDENNIPLISKELRDDILKNGVPSGYERKTRNLSRRDKELPKNIRYSTNGKKYRYSFDYKNKHYEKVFKTIPEAQEAMQILFNKLKQEDYLNKTKQILRNRNGIPYIPVNQNGKIICFLVNKKVWKDLMRYTWCYGNKSGTYARMTTETGSSKGMHVYIYENYIGKLKEGETVDHIKSNRKRDNRIKNLRALSYKGQAHNTIKKKTISELPVGVSIEGNKFVTTYCKKYYGSFDFMEDAAKKYNEIAVKEHGENAKLNNITETKTKIEDIINKNTLNINGIQTIKQMKLFLKLNPELKKKCCIDIKNINRSTFKKHKETLMNIIEEQDNEAENSEEEIEDYNTENDEEDETTEDEI